MSNSGFPITKFQIEQSKKYLRAFITIAAGIIIFGNIITAVFKKKVVVCPNSYTLREGFPFFNNSKDYIRLIKNYPNDLGTKIKIHKISQGESFWDIARQYNISIDTIIAANPFLKTLMAEEGTEIVVPLEEGVLLAIDDMRDAFRMSKILDYKDKIKGDYLHTVFELLSLDDIRFSFFKKVKPVIVSKNLQRLYNIRREFSSPIIGRITSLYGNRSDPLFSNLAFHNGVDLQAQMGTSIHPVTDGIVTSTGWNEGYGLTIVVQHDNGYASMYGHCSSIIKKKGDWVTKKDIIAKVGSTGRSTGSHLHFMMMRHGRTINPLLFIW